MIKLINGIIEFRKNTRKVYRETFEALAKGGQSPDVLMFTCSDSRVDPGLFASTDPGDVFTVRNVGNLVPPCTPDGVSVADESEASALEFALSALAVKHIIVCGHSDCGAIRAICNDRNKVTLPNLKSWLRHGELALKPSVIVTPKTKKEVSPENQVSLQNVLNQIENLKKYPLVQEKLSQRALQLHAWWFDIGSAEVWAYRQQKHAFEVINENVGKELISEVSSTLPISDNG